MIGLFTVFEVMKPQGKYLEELYSSGKYKLTWVLVVAFPTLHVYFIYIKYAYFVTLIKYILELLKIFFCENVCRLIR